MDQRLKVTQRVIRTVLERISGGMGRDERRTGPPRYLVTPRVSHLPDMGEHEPRDDGERGQPRTKFPFSS